MRISTRIGRMLVVVVAAASAFTTVPANAEPTGVIALAGTGSFSPGLVTVGTQPQTFALSASGALSTADPATAGHYQCFANGYAPPAGATGGIEGGCTTPCGAIGLSASLVSEGVEMAVSGSVTSGCLGGSSFAGDCAFAPAVVTIGTFTMVCDLNFEGLSGAVVLVGTGTMQPDGYFSYGADGAGTAGGDNGTLNCTITGNDDVGTINQSIGDYTGNCTTPCGAVTVSGSYDRTSAEMGIVGNFTSGCLAPATLGGNCLFTPIGALAVTNFGLACVFEVT